MEETRKKEEERGKERWGKRDSGFYHSFIPSTTTLLFSFLSLSGTNNYSFLCHQLEQSTPLSLSLSLCICVCTPLQGLTIIRSTETDTHLVCLGSRGTLQVSANTGTVMTTNTPATLKQPMLHWDKVLCVLLYSHEHTLPQEHWGFRWFSFHLSTMCTHTTELHICTMIM